MKIRSGHLLAVSVMLGRLLSVSAEAGSQAVQKPDQTVLNSNLLWAARAGDVAGVKAALQQGADPRAKDALEWPALVLAAADGHTEVVGVLLDQKIYADVAGRGGWTALMEAAGRGHLETVKLLLERGAKLQERNNWARSAYDIALDRNPTNVIHFLEQQGAKKPPPAALLQAAYWGDLEGLQELLEKDGGSAATADNLGQILHIAVEYGRTTVAESLVARGADVNYPDPNPRTVAQVGRTPLITVLENPRFPEMVGFLISKGADVNKPNQRGVTPLDLAERISDPSLRKRIIEELQKAGAKPKEQPKKP